MIPDRETDDPEMGKFYDPAVVNSKLSEDTGTQCSVTAVAACR